MKRTHKGDKGIEPFIQYHPIISSNLLTSFSIYFRIRLITEKFLSIRAVILKLNRNLDRILVRTSGGDQNKILQYNMEEAIQYFKEVSEVEDSGLSALEYRNSLLKLLDNPRRWRRLFDQLTDTDIMYSRLVNARTVKFLLSGDEITLLDGGNWSIYQKKTNFGYNVTTKSIYKLKYQITV